jgi:GMP synthase (glutamine-hydrolysing)
MRPPRICLYVVGEPPARIAAARGRYRDWFARLADGAEIELEPVDGRGGRLPGGFAAYDGFVITGSAASLTAPEPWMEAAVELVREAYGRGRPLLGVCFGHQLIGAAFGGSVVPNPDGWRMSTYAIELTEAGAGDPLFAGLPERPRVNLSHRDIVDATTLSPMNGVTVLAADARDAVQAIAAGPNVRGVQFHPEFDGAILRDYIDERADDLAGDADERADDHGQPAARRRRAADSPHGERVFGNFLRHWVLRR